MERPRTAPPQATPVVTPPTIVHNNRLSEVAEERRGDKAQDLIPPLIPQMSCGKETKPNESSEPMDTDHGSASSASPSTPEHTQGQPPTAAPSQACNRDRSRKDNIKSATAPHQAPREMLKRQNSATKTREEESFCRSKG